VCKSGCVCSCAGAHWRRKCLQSCVHVCKEPDSVRLYVCVFVWCVCSFSRRVVNLQAYLTFAHSLTLLPPTFTASHSVCHSPYTYSYTNTGGSLTLEYLANHSCRFKLYHITPTTATPAYVRTCIYICTHIYIHACMSLTKEGEGKLRRQAGC